MKQGTTPTLEFKLEITVEEVRQVIFTFSEKVDSETYLLQKTYPTNVEYDEDLGIFKVGLTQEETELLTNTFFVEAQVVFGNNSVIKSDIGKQIMSPTLWTTLIENNHSNGHEEVITLTFSDYIKADLSKYYTKEETDELLSLKADTTAVEQALALKQDVLEAGRGMYINGSFIRTNGTMLHSGNIVPTDNQLPLNTFTDVMAGDIYDCTTNDKRYLIVRIAGGHGGSLALVKPFENVTFQTTNPPKRLGNTDTINSVISTGTIWVNRSNDLVFFCKYKEYDNGYFNYTWIALTTEYAEGTGAPPTTEAYESGVPTYRNHNYYIDTTNNNLWFLVSTTTSSDGYVYTWLNLSDHYTKSEVDNLLLDLGNNISVSIDSSTYVMTVSLKHGNSILASGTVDLPLETMVVSGSYDAQTKKIILTLQNGQTVEFSVADLVSGLVSAQDLQTALANYQPLIDSSHKVSADNIDDSSSTNKFVPTSSQADSGKFLRVNAQGNAVWESVPQAEDNTF